MEKRSLFAVMAMTLLVWASACAAVAPETIRAVSPDGRNELRLETGEHGLV